ncbi:MAG: SGNH/GDSL hydrolase family protein [Bryobacteraceae bacterium]
MEKFTKGLTYSFTFALLVLGIASPALPASRKFQLRNGDRVLFYGDSITEQRYYPVAIETYVRTRFPDLKVKFRNSAVGGATVTGNWTAPVDLSLKRDVFSFKPNIVTIMLGMNDGRYRPMDAAIFDTYKNGYEHIIKSLQAHLPGVTIVLIEPTPWDDITQTPSYPHNPNHEPGGYDSVLRRYSAFVRKLGAQDHLTVVDFHTPLVKLMKEAEKKDPALAGKIIPKRIHPGPSTELVMAQALLKAWNAPALVSDVQINAKASSIKRSDNTAATNLSLENGKVSWTQTDKALPYPIMTLHSTKWPQFPPDPFGREDTIFWPMPPLDSPAINPVAALVTKLTGMYQALDSEMLQASGLKAASYTLGIDGHPVGTFSKEQLAHGINLAQHDTPMMDQSYKVLSLVWHRVDIRFYGWRGVQVALRKDKTPGIQEAVDNLLTVLNREQNDLVAKAHAAAQPQPHHYELTPVAQ